jgi:hypothetical protein
MKQQRDAQQGSRIPKLVDDAGRLKEERSAIDKAYAHTREELQFELQLAVQPDASGKIDSTFDGEEFYAHFKTGVENSVNVKKLFRQFPDIFWKLVKIGVGDVEKALGKVEAKVFIVSNYADTPTLTINRRREAARSLDAPQKPNLRSVA